MRVRTFSFNLGSRNSLARTLVMATVGSAGVRIVGMALTFLVGVQLAHFLGPTGYGVYGTVMAVVTLLLVPAQLGLPQLIARAIPAAIVECDFAKVKGTLIWFTSVVLIASVAMVALGVIGVFVASGENDPIPSGAYLWGLSLVPLIALSALAAGALRGFHRVVGAQYYEVLIRPALLACLLLLAGSYSGGVSPGSALALQALSTLLALALCVWHVLSISMKGRAMHVVVAARPSGWLASALPMTGTELIRALEGQYPILMIGALASIVDVGVFRVALSAAGFFGLPATLINLVVMSYVATLHAEGDKVRLQRLATGSAVLMFMCTLALTVIIYIFGVELIAIIFGDAFRSAWPVLIALGIAYSVNAFFGSAATILNMTGLERVVPVAYVSGLLVGLTLTLALLGPLGIVGAGVAAIASECVKGGILWFAAMRQLNVDTAATSIIRHRADWRQAAPIKQRREAGQ